MWGSGGISYSCSHTTTSGGGRGRGGNILRLFSHHYPGGGGGGGGGGSGFADHGSEKPSLAQTVAAHGHNPLWLRLVLAEIAFLFPFESSS